ncbi:Hypothetical protein DEACI_3480 [Acididesulfobacillus acetoxydans]|uniref:Uncharacterized protein n=1 Tax=Acididesulfobacillus acetoxydans TaxID=1561005 RepID=A0A8S0X0W6_9FIRM|nr:Hypothetical protein DEACI_3480 [Acididesulfobacillus acetoxydans]CEJ06342.1 Hypothetical protein DEACI_0790 [Acididesulfobacillus acetoxydans]
MRFRQSFIVLQLGNGGLPAFKNGMNRGAILSFVY